MTTNEIAKLKEKLHKELNGDRDHDEKVLLKWAERFGNDPEAEEILEEIAALVLETDPADEPLFTDAFLEERARLSQETLGAAYGLIEDERPEEALELLMPLVDELPFVPLSEDCVWTDFREFLDGMLFQEYYGEEIRGREIRRHPLRPADVLFTAGSLLIELGREEEAVPVLEQLFTLDPVCPVYLFELGEAYKRTGRMEEAMRLARLSMYCARTEEELARAYRDLAYCLGETGPKEDAMMLYTFSLTLEDALQARSELEYLSEVSGLSLKDLTREKAKDRVREMGLPETISAAVLRNIAILNALQPEEG